MRNLVVYVILASGCGNTTYYFDRDAEVITRDGGESEAEAESESEGAACVPSGLETCTDCLDNNCNGVVNEACVRDPRPTMCPSDEICNNGVDDNENGFVNELCFCTPALCGYRAPSGGCWCDDECARRNDCCVNATTVCPVGRL